MSDDYTPTTRGVRQGYASGKLHRREMMPVAAKKAFDRWLVAHDAEKRTEWEAEQGETEWEDRTPWRGLRTGIRRSDTLAAKEAEAHVWSPRTRSEVLPVSDTTNTESEDET